MSATQTLTVDEASGPGLLAELSCLGTIGIDEIAMEFGRDTSAVITVAA